MKNLTSQHSSKQMGLYIMSVVLCLSMMACEKDNTLQEDLSGKKSKVNQSDDPNENGNTRLQQTQRNHSQILIMKEKQ